MINKMVKITFVIGVLLIALIFEKNPVWGIFIVGIYILFRFRKRKYNSSKGLIESGEKNTYMMIYAINQGFQSICDAINAQDTDIYYENEKKPNKFFKKNAVGMNIYKN
jgi:hypothetical protein